MSTKYRIVNVVAVFVMGFFLSSHLHYILSLPLVPSHWWEIGLDLLFGAFFGAELIRERRFAKQEK